MGEAADEKLCGIATLSGPRFLLHQPYGDVVVRSQETLSSRLVGPDEMQHDVRIEQVDRRCHCWLMDEAPAGTNVFQKHVHFGVRLVAGPGSEECRDAASAGFR